MRLYGVAGVFYLPSGNAADDVMPDYVTILLFLLHMLIQVSLFSLCPFTF
jgi:hypothetical protein